MTLKEELAAFYRRCGFSDTADRQACTVPVYTGCLLGSVLASFAAATEPVFARS